MTSSEPLATERPLDPELVLRLHRRSMIQLLIAVAALGAFLIGSALSPGAALLQWVEEVPWLVPIAFILFVVFQQAVFRKHRLRMDAPEFKAILRDEWRRSSTNRATRGALIAVLLAQIPLALLISHVPAAQLPIGHYLGHLPALRAVLGMAVSTVTLGLLAQLALFLFFDRDRE